ncbi:MAG: FG-GAP-like repeat-containing protein [Pirellulales bacterium]
MCVCGMAITLGSNIASLRGQRQLSKTSAELGTVFERLSSGQRINRASDDAAGLSIADSLNAQSRIFNQGVRNLNDGLSLLNIADSAIENLSDIVIRLEELAEQSANGVYTNKQRKALDGEAQALSKEFFRISKVTEFNGQRLLNGEFDTVNLQGGVGENAVLSAGVGGAIGTGSFDSRVSYSVGSNPASVSSGDFNGDGVLDLVTADSGPDTVSILLGLGNGNFAPRVSYTAGLDPYFVSAGDFNGDGVLDLVTADSGSSTASVLLGLGNGTFAQRVSYSVGFTPESVSTGDFNGDGVLDLVTADYNSITASVLLGLGNGSFAPRASYAVGGFPSSVLAGDFNGDGVLDLVTADRSSGTTSVLLGLGNGTFAPRVTYAVGSNPASVSSGDFNGDGVLDLVTADRFSNTTSVLLGLGNGTFASRVSYSVGFTPESVSTGDFNGDGILDLVSADSGSATASVLLGLGNGTFAQRVSYSVGSSPRSVSSGDFNGDGVLDLVTADYNSITASVLLGRTKDGVAPLLPFSLKTLADARQALPVFQRKREQLAEQRGEIGAFQSRIDVARNVLEVSRENFRAAESRIRDADIADESSRLVRLNILQQAASSVLAQANQQPALALQLLSG